MPHVTPRIVDRAVPAHVVSVAVGLSLTDLARIVAVALLMLGVGAGRNRLPILFPDSIGYNRAGESIYAVAATVGISNSGAMSASAIDRTAGYPDDGVSTARSPYYGFALASMTRIGGVWFAVAMQALAAAAALVLGARRLDVTPLVETAVVGIAATIGGLGFFTGVLLPDVFLGPVILALALLLTRTSMHWGERVFWVVMLFGGLLCHRAFLAVALTVVVLSAPFYRALWLDRDGWRIAVAACLVAITGHGLIGPVAQHVLHKPILTPPFVLARLASGHVLAAYLADVCPKHHFLLCDFRTRMPLPPDRFLWASDRDGGVYYGRSIMDRHRLISEADMLIVGAVKARPVDAVAEAALLSLQQFFTVGMSEFTEGVQQARAVDPALRSALAAYPRSGIVVGDYSLAAVSEATRLTYFSTFVVLAAALAVIAWPGRFGRRRTRPVDPRIIAAIVIIVGGLLANAGINATLSGVHDRYQGRIAWLAGLAAAAALASAVKSTARVSGADPRTPRRPD